MPFVDPCRRPAARRHAILRPSPATGRFRRRAERFRKRRRLATTRPTGSVQLPLQPRILVFQPFVALVQPRILALEPISLALDALKVAAQSFRLFPPLGFGRLLRFSLPSQILLMLDLRQKHKSNTLDPLPRPGNQLPLGDLLLRHVDEYLVLDKYQPGRRTGPAGWVRCVVDRTVGEPRLPDDRPPLVYLPGVALGDEPRGSMTAAALREMRAADPLLRRLIDGSGPVAFRRTKRQPFEALLRAIVYQQLSGRAAGAIYARVAALFDGGRPTPRALAALAPERLRAAGLSRAKTLALHDLAAKAGCGVVPGPRTVNALSDEDVIERVVQVRGVGRWTGEMLLMHLGRPDVLPATDLGIRRGFARARGLDGLPEAEEILAYGERWRPWRSIASLYLWRAADLSAGDLPTE